MLDPVSSPARHRLFFALFPPPLIARRIANWAERRFGPHGAFVRADRLHVTLDIFEDSPHFPREMAERLVEAAELVAADPFLIELDQVSMGGGSVSLRPRLRNRALHQLTDAIVAARADAEIEGRSRYRFNPHVTLLYRNAAPFSEPVTPFAWEVGEFALIHSLLGSTRYEIIGSWPLRGRNAAQYALL